MFGLPDSTAVKKQIPKKTLFEKFGITSANQTQFDSDISRIDIVNYIAPKTIPALLPGESIKDIYVVEVQLKHKKFKQTNIELIPKLIHQNLVLVLHFDQECLLAVYHARLFTSRWMPMEEVQIQIDSTNLDSIWEAIVTKIGDFSIESGNSLNEQIDLEQEKKKITAEIALYEKKLANSRQAHTKRVYFEKIKSLRQDLAKLTSGIL